MFQRPKNGASQKTLLNIYSDNTILLSKQNPIKPKSDSVIRMMTWNIHYWSKIVANNDTDINDKTEKKEYANWEAILKDIVEINPDIACLQEVNYGKTKYINSDLNDELNKRGYIIISYCNTTSSWFEVPYGNIIIGRKGMNWCANAVKPCNIAPTIPQRNNVYKINSEGKSTKCFIETIYNNVKIICTHLDVYDNTGRIREKQIEELDQYIGSTCPTIIFGDFNLVNEQDYQSNQDDKDWYNYISTKLGMNGQAYDLIKSKGWVDSFDIVGTKPKYTTWNITRIDFIFLKNFKTVPNIDMTKLLDDCFVYYTTNSDHIQVIIDFSKSEFTKLSESPVSSTCNKVKIYPIEYQ